MICIGWCTSLIKIKAGFYIKKIILIITMRRGLLGKTKRNQKNEKIQKIAVKYFLPSSFYPLEVAFLKLAK